MARESKELALQRWSMLEMVQGAYPTFVPFLHDVMDELGFHTTKIQVDIALFLEFGPHYLMVQAQRGQAKTTITAAYAVWCLIHDPTFRVLVISAGGTQANEIATLIVRIITRMDELACLRPDAANGDRTSVEAFDVHYTLKGEINKSPSVACIGITGNLQGKRADLIIADDVESAKNSMTDHQREVLLQLTRDFPSICETGRIVYLGTPQSRDSIYNSLPGRGYTVRIWPGRYPTADQLKNYGDMLAPMLRRELEANPSLQTGGGFLGDQGQPTDTELPAGNEQFLVRKEQDQGQSYFQLQHMLNTRLADADRYPLHLDKIQVVRVTGDLFPLAITPGLLDHQVVKYGVCGSTFTLGVPAGASADRAKLQGILMYVDPAGGGINGDETGYAVVGFLNGNVWVLDVGGIRGGYSPESLQKLTDIAVKWQVNLIRVEKNLGNGAFLNAWLPYLRAGYLNKDGKPAGCSVTEDWASGQKEARIIDTLEPVIGRGSLIFNDDIARNEAASLAPYATDKRMAYSLLHQMSRITRDKDSLQHDDRLDALAGAVRYWVAQLGIDQDRAIQQQREREFSEWQKNPLGRSTFTPHAPKHGGSLFNKYRR